jgi:hypothetical protein
MISDKYGRLASTLAVVIAFSSVVPALYLVGLVMCIHMYWIDKYLLLRVYRNPTILHK